MKRIHALKICKYNTVTCFYLHKIIPFSKWQNKPTNETLFNSNSQMFNDERYMKCICAVQNMYKAKDMN